MLHVSVYRNLRPLAREGEAFRLPVDSAHSFN